MEKLSMATKYVKGKIYKLAIADLQPDPNQTRSFMDTNALNELADALGKSQVAVSTTITLNKLPEDVRYACRTNPNIPKIMLMEAAMSRKFKKDMDKAGKATQPAAVKQRLSKQHSLIMQTDGLTGKLSGLPWQEWSEDDWNDLTNTLLGIRSQVQGLLRDMNALPAEDQPVLPGNNNLA